MKINKDSFVFGSRILLVPYQSHHVLKYHRWMQSEELQILTASKPLSLEEEYDMQRKWQEDDDKCTFIVLDLVQYNNGEKKQENETDSMIGDVNLFFNDDTNRKTAEIEIMIAETSSRGKGFGKEALLSMIRYGVENLHLDRITAKIGYDNKASICMFKKLLFQEVSRSDIFREVTFELNISDDIQDVIRENTPHFKIEVKA